MKISRQASGTISNMYAVNGSTSTPSLKVVVPRLIQSSALPYTRSPSAGSEAHTVLTNSSMLSTHDTPIPTRPTTWLRTVFFEVNSTMTRKLTSGNNRISQGR